MPVPLREIALAAAAPPAAAPPSMMPPISFRTQELAPCPFYYLTRDDRLFVRSFNSLAAVRLVVRGRWMDARGQIHNVNHRHTPNTDRSSALEFIDLAEGFLHNLTVFVEAANPRRGQCFVQVGVGRGTATDFHPVALFISDYLETNLALGWPGGRLRSSVEGPGILRSITGTNPAANIEITETVPTNARWRLLSLQATFTADAAVGNRNPVFTFDDGASQFVRIGPSASIVAGEVAIFCGSAFGTNPGVGISAAKAWPIPDVSLSQGFRIGTIGSFVGVADDWAAPQMLVEEWIEE